MPGVIGYIELTYALNNDMTFTEALNKPNPGGAGI